MLDEIIENHRRGNVANGDVYGIGSPKSLGIGNVYGDNISARIMESESSGFTMEGNILVLVGKSPYVVYNGDGCPLRSDAS